MINGGVMKYIMILLLSTFLIAQEYQVEKSKSNLVKFISDAPIESFEGVTNHIDGYLFIESFPIIENSALYFEVDLNTLDTGIGLRNRHMRESYLETEKYQFSFFEGSISNSKSISKNNFEVTVQGKMFIHGITKDVTIPGIISIEGDYIHIKSNFTVALSDYKIDIPKLMFMKIDENMKLELDLYLSKINKN